MEALTFKLNVFEGPLDLMLFLIQKHKLSINEVEISELLVQYLDYINQMQAADLEVASEFLAMAARLVYIKTVSLLPVHEEAEALEQELKGQLLEYQLCKEMAGKLRERDVSASIWVRQPLALPADKEYRLHHDPDVLIEAYLAIAGRAMKKMPPPRSAFSGIIERRIVSMESRIVYILRRLYQSGQVAYEEFFAHGDRSELVATFLAVLELIKSKRICMSDDNSRLYFRREMTEEEIDAMEGAEQSHGTESSDGSR